MMIELKDIKLQPLIDEVYKHGQEHVFRFWDQMQPEQKQDLLEQISQIDFDLIARLTQQALGQQKTAENLKLDPPPVISLAERRKKDKQADVIGREALHKGKVAAFLVAGGQGTRLGFDGPKGMFPVTPVKKKSLFQLHAEKLLSISRQNHTRIPWYIMTSVTNDNPTKRFLKENNYFGYEEDDLFIFTQEMIPAIDRQGKFILDRPDHIFMNPNGHGGAISALWKKRALQDMKKRGVEYIFYFQVDNVLTRICDPVYIGYHITGQSEMSCKVVHKKYPEEKMGVLCKVGNELRLIEYSDMSDEEMHARNPDRSLKLWAGNIATHLFNRRFLEKENESGFKLPYHTAEKSIPYLDEKGMLTEPHKKNGIKFETFVFDALADAQNTVCIEVDRTQEFSPLKNSEGENSPETVRADLNRVYRDWLVAAGHQELIQNDQKDVEISPLASLYGENLNLENLKIEDSEEGIYIYRR